MEALKITVSQSRSLFEALTGLSQSLAAVCYREAAAPIYEAAAVADAMRSCVVDLCTKLQDLEAGIAAFHHLARSRFFTSCLSATRGYGMFQTVTRRQ